jgi:hypothetical protein
VEDAELLPDPPAGRRRVRPRGHLPRRPPRGGIPIIPSDKVPVEDGKTKIILVRTGEERQGVVGLFQPGLVGEQAPGLSVRFTGINKSAIATYLVTLYTSLAVLTDDALAVLDNVAVDQFHEYK